MSDDFMVTKKLGARIRAMRLNRALTQKQLADRAGGNHANVSNIEAGNRNPSCALLMRMVLALELKPKETHWLMTGMPREHELADRARIEPLPPTSEDILRARRLA